MGPFRTEDEALEKAGDLGEVRAYKFPTRNTSRATQMIKAKLVRHKGIGGAMQRVRHGKRPAKPDRDDFEDSDPLDEDDDEEV